MLFLPGSDDELILIILIFNYSGSDQLIAQGLRTLELCIDNLQPNFFYDKIEVTQSKRTK